MGRMAGSTVYFIFIAQRQADGDGHFIGRLYEYFVLLMLVHDIAGIADISVMTAVADFFRTYHALGIFHQDITRLPFD